MFAIVDAGSITISILTKYGGWISQFISMEVGLTPTGLFLLIRYLNGITDGLYDCAQDLGCQITLKLGQHGHQEVKFFHVEKKGVDWVFVDHPWYHRSGTPYGDDLGTFGDNLMR